MRSSSNVERRQCWLRRWRWRESRPGWRVHELCITLLLCALGLGQYLQIGLHLHFHFDPRRRRRPELPRLELELLLLVVVLPLLLNLNPEVSAAGAENTRKVGEREMFALPRLRLLSPLPAALLVSLDTPEWRGREDSGEVVPILG